MSLVSFKTSLKLNNKQATLAAKHAGVARHAYNWGLNVCFQALENKEKIPTAIDLHKKLVAEVKSVNEWYYEVSKCAPQQALRNLNQAFKNWLKHKHCKKPIFKKKGRRDSFYLDGSIRISGNKIKIPIFSWITCDEILPTVIPKNVTISKRAGKWFISFKYELEHKPTPKKLDKIGVDIGINALATCSDGTVFPNPKAYRKQKRRLARLQRKVSKKQKRVYKCSNCGATIDRDLNASINLKNYRSTPSSGETCKRKACGEVKLLESITLETSTNQEVSFKPIQLSLFDLLSKFE